MTLPVPGARAHVTLTVPHCRLAELMSARLNTLPAGQEITRQLTTTPRGGETRMIYGPDMQPLAAEVCLVQRLRTRCEPAFVQTLTLLTLEGALPEVG